MSDPFDRLRVSSSVDVPSVSAIRSRARTIQRRRYVAVSSAAVIVLVVAGVGLFVRPKPVERRATSGIVALSTPHAAPAVPAPEKAAQSYSAAQNDSSASSGSAALAARPVSDQLVVSVQVAGSTFTLSACNGGSSATTRTFPDSERYDFEVSRNGAVVWRWSDGQAFSQIVGSETWKPHECKRWSGTWDEQGAASGTYQVVGILKSSPELRTKPASFCVRSC